MELDDDTAGRSFTVLCSNCTGTSKPGVGCLPQEFAD